MIFNDGKYRTRVFIIDGIKADENGKRIISYNGYDQIIKGAVTIIKDYVSNCTEQDSRGQNLQSRLSQLLENGNLTSALERNIGVRRVSTGRYICSREFPEFGYIDAMATEFDLDIDFNSIGKLAPFRAVRDFAKQMVGELFLMPKVIEAKGAYK